MANSLERKVAALFRERGSEFNRADMRALERLLAREPDLDVIHETEAGAHEALRLIINDPRYSGDLTLADLEGPTTPEQAADALLERLLG